MKRIALYGGTFNPIHMAHLRVAEEVREMLGFEKVLFMPTGTPPHKGVEGLLPAEDRLHMVRLAIAGNPFFEASDMEIQREGVSYTIDTVRELQEEGTHITIITGTDQFNAITTWHSYEELFNLADFVVVERPGTTAKKLSDLLPVELAGEFCYDNSDNVYINKSDCKVRYIEAAFLRISASDIRDRLKRGASIKYLVPPELESYIREKGFYI